MSKVKLNVFKVISLFFVLSFLGDAIFLWSSRAELDWNQTGITQIETITSTIQRISKIELEGTQDDSLIASIDEMCE